MGRLGVLVGDESLAVELGVSFAAGDSAQAEVRSATPGSVARLTFHATPDAAPSTLQLRVIPVGEDRATVAVHHEVLPDAAARRAMRLDCGARHVCPARRLRPVRRDADRSLA